MAPSLPAFHRLIEKDPWLEPYQKVLERRTEKVRLTGQRLTRGKIDLADFAAGHMYFGLHVHDNNWVFREWAPHATHIYIIGDMTDWKPMEAYALERQNTDGIWEIKLPEDSLAHGNLYRLRMQWTGGEGDRIVGAQVLSHGQTLFAVTENGFGKRTSVDEYPVHRRGGKGVITIKTSERNGQVVSIHLVEDDDDLMLMTDQGKLIRMPASGISVISRNTQGVKLIGMDENEKVADAARLAEKD